MSEIGNPKRVLAVGESVLDQQTIQMEPNDRGITTDHPLNNELILGIIFDHLPKKKYWKSVRLVNKTWHSTLQSRWRAKIVYKLGLGWDFPLIGTYTAKWNSPMFQLLEQQLTSNNPDDLFQFGRYPIRNISVGWFINDNYMRLRSDQSQFWKFYGSGLKCLHLDRVRIHEVALFKTLLFELTPCLEEFRYYECICNDMKETELNTATKYTPLATVQKNLKYVNVNTKQLKPWDCRKFKFKFPISWMEFFSVFPNIDKLTLEIEPQASHENNESYLLKVFETIDIIRKANNNQVLNITKLDAPDLISILHIGVSEMSNDEIITLVQIFKSTLRDLVFRDPDHRQAYLPNDFALPQGLTKLGLLGPLFSSFEFLSNTPNLEELELGNITYMLQPEVCANLSNITPLVNLKKLKYKIQDPAPNARMEILAKLMPNIKTCICRGNVDAEGFQTLSQGWTNLEHLDLQEHFNFFNEDLFVGSLIQLKCLKSLKINWDRVSDKSIFEGFLTMHSLTRIHLPFPSDVDISDEGREALEEKLQVEFDL